MNNSHTAKLTIFFSLLLIVLSLLLYTKIQLSQKNRKPANHVALNLTIINGELSDKKAIYDELLGHKISSTEIYGLTNSLDKLFDFRTAKPKDSYKLCLNPDKSINKFIYQASPYDVYVAVKTTENAFSTYKEAVYINKVQATKTFTLKSSLYQAIAAGGERDSLANSFADIFSWDIDFFLYPQPGDTIKIYYEKYEKAGELIKYGKVLGAQYIGKEKTFSAFLYNNGKNEAYYDLEGNPLRKMFRKMPLEFGRISSTFNLKRFHPILRRIRPHLGTDYASYYNAPVQATGTGSVSFSGWLGGYGNLVIIRHPNGYETYYGHNSKNLVRTGQQIDQGQTIALVGSTGQSTGPHVHYEVRCRNIPINPSSLKTISLHSLTGNELSNYKQGIEKQVALLNSNKDMVFAKNTQKENNLVKNVFKNIFSMVNKIFIFA
ncbi:MAG: hypothetical protein DKM50_09345 [Candidatus Margulisiibacteriota bacterium]|nr:MAG: hypothetical protein DKM50_09345 [Candidatus Margulisiibacteriota bacterium]HCY38054.1 hypothetical protein [Candidatus Margulisiibacteriota bacterium]